ncbi:hypothetical protein AB5I39_04075 [Sphingomonas sp. MMS24-J45]|uniref:hypothetical protein n=1 Tax=Sphingomonas sp. MMS24-J45 TaxID=3238806 RepID=UPI003850205E
MRSLSPILVAGVAIALVAGCASTNPDTIATPVAPEAQGKTAPAEVAANDVVVTGSRVPGRGSSA